ncbi:MAG: hypothetical protein F6J86_16015 [Symploca sp. SIO1B1]|nr:hypothetical protein [Symploca sp. SIO1B1]
MGITVFPHNVFADELETGAVFYEDVNFVGSSTYYEDMEPYASYIIDSTKFKSAEVGKKSQVWIWYTTPPLPIGYKYPDLTWDFNQPDFVDQLEGYKSYFMHVEPMEPKQLLSVRLLNEQADDSTDCLSIKVRDVDDPDGEPIISCVGEGYQIVGSLLQQDIDEGNQLQADIYHPYPPTEEFVQLVGFFTPSNSPDGDVIVDFEIPDPNDESDICWEKGEELDPEYGHTFDFKVVDPSQIGDLGECNNFPISLIGDQAQEISANPTSKIKYEDEEKEYCKEKQETQLDYQRQSCTINSEGKGRIYARIKNEGRNEEMLNFDTLVEYCVSGGVTGSGLRVGTDSYIALDCDPVEQDYKISLSLPTLYSDIKVLWFGLDK